MKSSKGDIICHDYSCKSILILRNIHWRIQAKKAIDYTTILWFRKNIMSVCMCMCVRIGVGTERESTKWDKMPNGSSNFGKEYVDFCVLIFHSYNFSANLIFSKLKIITIYLQ